MKKTYPKIKNLQLSKFTIECHPDALNVFMAAKDYAYQYEELDLSKETIQLFQSYNPLHTVEASRNNYLFFSGWFWLSYCRLVHCDKLTIIVHSGIDQNDIQKAAWAYFLSSQFQSFHRHNNLAQIKQYFDLMPDHIKSHLLGSIGTSSPQVLTQKLSNESRSAVRNQEKHFKPSVNKSSIREQLTWGNKNVP